MNAPAISRHVVVAIAKRVAAYPKPIRPAVALAEALTAHGYINVHEEPEHGNAG